MLHIELNMHELILYTVLFFAVSWLLFAVMRSSKDPHSRICIEDLLLDDKHQMSKAAVVMLGAFLLTTWLMIYLAVSGKMTEMYFATYVAAWITPTVARLISGQSQAEKL